MTELIVWIEMAQRQITNVYCEQCREVTPHVEKQSRATRANPTADGNVRPPFC